MAITILFHWTVQDVLSWGGRHATFWFWVRPMAMSADVSVVTLWHKRALPVVLIVATTYGRMVGTVPGA